MPAQDYTIYMRRKTPIEGLDPDHDENYTAISAAVYVLSTSIQATLEAVNKMLLLHYPDMVKQYDVIAFENYRSFTAAQGEARWGRGAVFYRARAQYLVKRQQACNHAHPGLARLEEVYWLEGEPETCKDPEHRPMTLFFSKQEALLYGGWAFPDLMSETIATKLRSMPVYAHSNSGE